MPYTVDAATNGCYEGTTVLINKFGLRDAEALAEVEAAVVPAKAAMWEAKPLCETFDFAHYKAIHHWLFEDLYEWAGEVRTIDLSKKRNNVLSGRGNKPCCPGDFFAFESGEVSGGAGKTGICFATHRFLPTYQ